MTITTKRIKKYNFGNLLFVCFVYCNKLLLLNFKLEYFYYDYMPWETCHFMSRRGGKTDDRGEGKRDWK